MAPAVAPVQQAQSQVVDYGYANAGGDFAQGSYDASASAYAQPAVPPGPPAFVPSSNVVSDGDANGYNAISPGYSLPSSEGNVQASYEVSPSVSGVAGGYDQGGQMQAASQNYLQSPASQNPPNNLFGFK